MLLTYFLLFALLVGAIYSLDCDGDIENSGEFHTFNKGKYYYKGGFQIENKIIFPHGNGTLKSKNPSVGLEGCFSSGIANGKFHITSEQFLLKKKEIFFAEGFVVQPNQKEKLEEGLRILTLDGGGVRGLIIINQLKELEKRTGMKIRDMFDIIGGTSTGGIIALAIMRGLSLEEIEEKYTNLAVKVFPQVGHWIEMDLVTSLEDFYQKLKGPKYDGDSLLQILNDFVGNESLSELHYRYLEVFVTAQIKTGENDPVIISNMASGSNKRRITNIPISLAARATSAAPTYFSSVEFDSLHLIDGGAGFNNPSELALEEAQSRFYGRPIQLFLSLGTGKPPYTNPTAEYSLPQIIKKIAEVTAQVSMSNSNVKSKLAERDCHEGSCYFRLDPACKFYDLADSNPEVLKELKGLTQQYIRENTEMFDTISRLIQVSNYRLTVSTTKEGEGHESLLIVSPKAPMGANLLPTASFHIGNLEKKYFSMISAFVIEDRTVTSPIGTGKISFKCSGNYEIKVNLEFNVKDAAFKPQVRYFPLLQKPHVITIEPAPPRKLVVLFPQYVFNIGETIPIRVETHDHCGQSTYSTDSILTSKWRHKNSGFRKGEVVQHVDSGKYFVAISSLFTPGEYELEVAFESPDIEKQTMTVSFSVGVGIPIDPKDEKYYYVVEQLPHVH